MWISYVRYLDIVPIFWFVYGQLCCQRVKILQSVNDKLLENITFFCLSRSFMKLFGFVSKKILLDEYRVLLPERFLLTKPYSCVFIFQ
jgi:hypothetical protein